MTVHAVSGLGTVDPALGSTLGVRPSMPALPPVGFEDFSDDQGEYAPAAPLMAQPMPYAPGQMVPTSNPMPGLPAAYATGPAGTMPPLLQQYPTAAAQYYPYAQGADEPIVPAEAPPPAKPLWPWILGFALGGVVLAGGAIVIYKMSRRKKKRPQLRNGKRLKRSLRKQVFDDDRWED